MPSFDVVSELDSHQVTNAVDQANRIVTNRFDFKGVDATFTRDDGVVTIQAESDFQVQQMFDMLSSALHKCGIDIRCLKPSDIELLGKTAKQKVVLQEGIESLLAKKIVKMIKEQKMKVQAAIQGEQVRITGKKRDDLQVVMGLLKESDIEVPLQFNNFRD